MRDAAVYAKEENWSKAVELWKQTYETKKREQWNMVCDVQICQLERRA